MTLVVDAFDGGLSFYRFERISLSLLSTVVKFMLIFPRPIISLRRTARFRLEANGKRHSIGAQTKCCRGWGFVIQYVLPYAAVKILVYYFLMLSYITSEPGSLLRGGSFAHRLTAARIFLGDRPLAATNRRPEASWSTPFL